MATVNTRYVDVDAASGGDGTTNALTGANCAYKSLSIWEAARQADIVTADVIEECIISSQDAAHTADTTYCTISGWTTDATRYIDIKVAAGSGHVGVWDTSKYRLITSTIFQHSLSISEEYCRVDGLQVENTQAGAGGYGAIASTGANTADQRATNCLARSALDHTVQAQGGKLTCTNVIAFPPAGAEGFRHSGYARSSNFYNCASVGGTRGFHRTAGGGTTLVKNCYSGGATTADFGSALTQTTNASADTTAGGTSGDSIAYSTANFTNVTAGSEDLTLVSGAAAYLQTGGTDLSATFTTDITGATRPTGAGTWSVGPFQYVSSGAADATASGSISITGSATATVAVSATASGGFTIGGSAAATVAVAASAAGSFTIAGSATVIVGNPPVDANASGSFTIAGTATATVAIAASASGSFTIAGSATATIPVTAAASGGFTVAGSAEAISGFAPAIGAASGGFTVSGSATATVAVSASTTGVILISGSALANVSLLAVASGSFTISGSATALATFGVPPSTAFYVTTRSGARYAVEDQSEPRYRVTRRE